jgi:hypothetical protein
MAAGAVETTTATTTDTTAAMTDHVARLYALALGSLSFLVAWAVVAANPLPAKGPERDTRLVALEARAVRLAREQQRVNETVERRFAAYRRALAERRRLQALVDAAAPAARVSPAATAFPEPTAPAPVQVTPLPPVTASGSS